MNSYVACLLLCFVVLISGCASVPPPVVTYDQSARYGIVSLFINDGVVDESYSTIGYTTMRIVDQTGLVLKEELARTGVFSYVDFNNPYQEVVLNVSFVRRATDENIAKAVFQGGTLFLIPTTNKIKSNAKIAVRVKAKIVKVYDYELDSVQRMFLGDDPYAERRAVAKSLWSRFIADAQKDKLFEELVPAALEAQKVGAEKLAK